jgi:hypothetical protein
MLYEMTIGSNTDGDLISFKYYDYSEDVVLDITETYEFTTNGQIGSLLEPLYYNIGSDDTPCEDVGLFDGSMPCEAVFANGGVCGELLWGAYDVSAACPESCGLCGEECVDDVTGAYDAQGGCDVIINGWGVPCETTVFGALVSEECPLSCDTCPDEDTIRDILLKQEHQKP